MAQPKTIITYLVDGNPTGIKTVELSNWIGKAIVIPRSKLKESKDRSETQQPAIYFLFGEDESGVKQAYIGEAENLINRLANHATNKDFWDIVVAFISKDNNLTKADVKFLEANAIKKGLEVNRFELLNSVEPIPNNLPEYQASTMSEFLENINILISAIGYPVIKDYVIDNKFIDDSKIYSLTVKGLTAKGFYNEDGFTIIKGSRGTKDVVQSQIGKSADLSRVSLFKHGVITKEDGCILFQDKYLFASPSGAAIAITGRAANGWLARKDKDGKTLDENERKSLDS